MLLGFPVCLAGLAALGRAQLSSCNHPSLSAPGNAATSQRPSWLVHTSHHLPQSVPLCRAVVSAACPFCGLPQAMASSTVLSNVRKQFRRQSKVLTHWPPAILSVRPRASLSRRSFCCGNGSFLYNSRSLCWEGLLPLGWTRDCGGEGVVVVMVLS